MKIEYKITLEKNQKIKEIAKILSNLTENIIIKSIEFDRMNQKVILFCEEENNEYKSYYIPIPHGYQSLVKCKCGNNTEYCQDTVCYSKYFDIEEAKKNLKRN